MVSSSEPMSTLTLTVSGGAVASSAASMLRLMSQPGWPIWAGWPKVQTWRWQILMPLCVVAGRQKFRPPAASWPAIVGRLLSTKSSAVGVMRTWPEVGIVSAYFVSG